MFEQVNALTVANCALNWGQKLPNNKYTKCNIFFTCLQNYSNTRERSNLHKLFCVNLLRSRFLFRHATLLATNGALEPNHILFLTFSQSDVCFHDVRKVHGMVTPPITAFLIWVFHAGLTKQIKPTLGSYRLRTRWICDAAGSNFSRSLFPCTPFSFLILVTSSLGNLKLTFLNNNVIRSPVLTKNFRASAVLQVSLTQVKEEQFGLTGSVTL